MTNIFKLSFFTLLIIVLAGCDNTDLDLLDNPNGVPPELANIEAVYANLGIEMAEFVDEASDETLPYVRMAAMSGGFQYNNQDGPGSFNFLWDQAYSVLFPDLDLVIKLGEERGLTYHSGSAKILKAYVLFTLVDLFGDVPYSEAFQGLANPSPKADDDASVYGDALTLLKAGIADMKDPGDDPDFDLFYDGNADSWVALGNSLLLRYYVQTRLVNSDAKSEINTLIGEDNLINEVSQDWEFKYSSNRANPDSRHPYYSDGYEDGGPSWYMSNYMMWQMFQEKGLVDPRLRYYFRRQDAFEDNENQFTLECQSAPYPLHWDDGYPWCTASGDIGDPNKEWGGYWGRNHGDASGIPPDDLKRTAWGLYPAGGAFDDLPKVDDEESPTDDAYQVSNMGVDGARGAGIQPIMLSNWVHFLRSEAALMLDTDDDPREQLKVAVEQSISKVMNFAPDQVDADFAPSTGDVEAYVNRVLELYDAATDDDSRLNVIIGEFRLALHGMGLDAYNAYRRTGKPSGMEPTFQANPGAFPRTFWYPADYVNRNAAATQRADLTTQVFWDTNPADFIN